MPQGIPSSFLWGNYLLNKIMLMFNVKKIIEYIFFIIKKIYNYISNMSVCAYIYKHINILHMC